MASGMQKVLIDLILAVVFGVGVFLIAANASPEGIWSRYTVLNVGLALDAAAAAPLTPSLAQSILIHRSDYFSDLAILGNSVVAHYYASDKKSQVEFVYATDDSLTFTNAFFVAQPSLTLVRTQNNIRLQESSAATFCEPTIFPFNNKKLLLDVTTDASISSHPVLPVLNKHLSPVITSFEDHRFVSFRAEGKEDVFVTNTLGRHTTKPRVDLEQSQADFFATLALTNKQNDLLVLTSSDPLSQSFGCVLAKAFYQAAQANHLPLVVSFDTSLPITPGKQEVAVLLPQSFQSIVTDEDVIGRLLYSSVEVYSS
ncbi:MAG: hypothetical protein H6502_02005 [Candidatus Woesearchaeota archaeon]|nr:MAG: hypothetical protein H6502_02005 [Candidatus Woesearchaeota archaeon]